MSDSKVTMPIASSTNSNGRVSTGTSRSMPRLEVSSFATKVWSKVAVTSLTNVTSNERLLEDERENSKKLVFVSIVRVFVAFLDSDSDLIQSESKKAAKFSRSLADLAKRIKLIHSSDVVQDYVKYWVSWWMSRRLDDKLPFPVKEEFHKNPLFTGLLLRFVRSQCFSRSTKSTRFFFSLLQCKKGWGPKSSTSLVEYLVKHQKVLGQIVSPITSNDASLNIDTESRNFGFFLNAAVEAVVSPGKSTIEVDRFLPPAIRPSLNAHFNRKRGDGGAAKGYAFPPIDYDWSLNDIYREEQTLSLDAVEKSELMAMLEMKCGNPCKVVPITEPAKYRTVSCGPGYTYSYLRPLQDRLLADWSRTTFSTMKIEKEEFPVWLSRLRRGKEFWNSGDYESATDLLDPRVSLRTLELILHRLEFRFGEPLGEIAIRSLMSELYYLFVPSDSHDKVKIHITQKRGQLMGHPLSFPLLCIINLAVMMYAQDSITPVCGINGDDSLANLDQDEFNRWSRACDSAGFKISLGKNYFCRDYLLINTLLFKDDLTHFTRVGYINQALLFHNKIKSNKECGKSTNYYPEEISNSLNELFDSCPESVYFLSETMKNHCHSTFLPHADWFLPVWRGGCGIHPRFMNDSHKVSKAALALAGATFLDPSLSVPSGLQRDTSCSKKVIGKIGKLSFYDPNTSVEDEARLPHRLNTYEKWFGFLLSAQTQRTGRPEDVDSATRRKQMLRRWNKARTCARPCSIVKAFEPPPKLVAPFLPDFPSGEGWWRYPSNGLAVKILDRLGETPFTYMLEPSGFEIREYSRPHPTHPKVTERGIRPSILANRLFGGALSFKGYNYYSNDNLTTKFARDAELEDQVKIWSLTRSSVTTQGDSRRDIASG